MAKKIRAIYEEWARDGNLHTWYVEDLWRAGDRLPVQAMALSKFEPYVDHWLNDKGPKQRYKDATGEKRLTVATFVRCRIEGWFERGGNHLERVRNADLDFPILFTPEWQLIDGYHRFVKAYLSGESVIRFKQFKQMPKPNRIGKKSMVSTESYELQSEETYEESNGQLIVPVSARW